MCESVLVKLLKAYKEEGYEISVGLNPFRESRHGAFAILAKLDSFESLPKISDDYFASIYPVGPSSSSQTASAQEVQDERNQTFVWRRAGISLKKFALVRTVYRKIKPFQEKDHLPSSASEPSRPSYLSTGGGISLQEIYFFETLLKAFRPKTDFLIGIGSGWSTIAFGLINPSAALYGIDNLSEGTQAREGLELTQRIAQKLSLDLTFHVGSSPDDVPEFLDSVGERIDFVFIDGLHTNEQVFLDFKCILPYVSDSVIIAFHDVLNWNMLEGWKKIIDVASKDNFKHAILRRTTSGIGILYRDINKTVEDCIEAFYQNPSLLCPT